MFCFFIFFLLFFFNFELSFECVVLRWVFEFDKLMKGHIINKNAAFDSC